MALFSSVSMFLLIGLWGDALGNKNRIDIFIFPPPCVSADDDNASMVKNEQTGRIDRILFSIPPVRVLLISNGPALNDKEAPGVLKIPGAFCYSHATAVCAYADILFLRDMSVFTVCCPYAAHNDISHQFRKHFCNQSETAKALFMHRSSVIRKLDRIIQLTGLDLDDYETRLHLMLSFELKVH